MIANLYNPMTTYDREKTSLVGIYGTHFISTMQTHSETIIPILNQLLTTDPATMNRIEIIKF